MPLPNLQVRMDTKIKAPKNAKKLPILQTEIRHTECDEVDSGATERIIPYGTYCKHDHVKTPENTRVYKRKDGYTPSVRCLDCERMHNAVYRRKQGMQPMKIGRTLYEYNCHYCNSKFYKEDRPDSIAGKTIKFCSLGCKSSFNSGRIIYKGIHYCKNNHPVEPGKRCKECRTLSRQKRFEERGYWIEPEKRNHVRDLNKQCYNRHHDSELLRLKKRREDLPDYQVASAMGIPVSEIHPAVLEIKRLTIKLKRELAK